MKNFNLIDPGGRIIALAFVVFAFGCTKIDDTLGSGFIPQDQTMTIGIDTLSGFDTYADLVDSLASTRMGVAIVGNDDRQSQLWGVTTAAAVVQYVPYRFSSKSRYGKPDLKVVVDSVKFSLTTASFFGDTLTVNRPTVDVYEVTKRINGDSSYYSNHNIAGMISDNPVFSFQLERSRNSQHEILFTRDNHASILDGDYITRLVGADTTIYSHDTLFLKTFNGFYLKSNDAKAVYNITLAKMGMVVYARNFEKEDPSKVKDTLSVSYIFDDNPKYFYPTSVNMFKHNYPVGGDILKTVDTLNTPTSSKIYLQAMGGVTPKIKFRDQLIDAINALKTNNGVTYKDIVISNAYMVVKSENFGTDQILYLDDAPNRIGSYLNYHKYTPTVDYNYVYEQNGYKIPYGGYYSRKLEEYKMDITTFVQRLLIKKEADAEPAPRVITFGPDVSTSSTYAGDRVMLKGDNSDIDQSIKLIITYTLIR